MFHKLSLLQKFSLICLTILLLLGMVLNLGINHLMEKNLIKHAEEMTSAMIQGEVLHELAREDLLSVKQDSDYRLMSKQIQHLSLGPNIERIKIWRPDGVILWADSPEMAGMKYADNHGLEEALYSNQPVVEMTWKGHERGESEHELESENLKKKLLELYVPITFPGSEQIDVVFEVYRNVEPLYAEFERQQKIVWCALFGSFTILFLALFSLVYRATRKIEAQRIDILESEARYRNLILSAQDAIISVRQDGGIVLCNPAAERIFACSAEELSGRLLATLLPDSPQQPVKRILRELFADFSTAHKYRVFQWHGVRCNGDQFPVELTFALSGENGNQLLTAILRDESERVLMQEKALEAEKLSGVSLIASSIGHEINNAISGLYCYAQMLKGKINEPAFVEKCADTMYTQSEQLRLHATNLLSLGKPQSPRIGLVNLNQLLEGVTDLLQTSGILKYYSVQKELTAELAEIAGDPHLLEQLIRNLQINASHAMGRKGTLAVRSGQQADGRIYFEIEDTGSGISAEKLEKIFEPFFTTKAEGEGTGLGLYIVRQVVEQHGGELKVESTLGVGTCFRVIFPEPLGVMRKLAG